jgi:predicted amidohydrolase
MKLTLSLAQMEVAAGRPEENLCKAEALVAEAAARGSGLVCFPEMWTTGFHWETIGRMAGEFVSVIKRVAGLARRSRIWINGSMPSLDDDGNIANTSLLISAEGEVAAIYRKIHLFSQMGEHNHLKAGNSPVLADTPWGRAGLAVCYDIRFPELFRTYALRGACLAICPSAFPHPRLEHWRILIRARAIENQMYFIAVNRAGREDLGPDGMANYFGHSTIVDPWGDTVAEALEDEILLTAEIELDLVSEVRSGMKVLRDRRPELYGLS